ncbi:hypothetical protein GI584_00155 [Gracilibacillus salitolerans]|uniref:Uncharacterized protein n=1 Tax=Gracilibacillus salitolerans TaxID=2663022 RepID=A0A5Q2TES1_9BACI|nr:hypothetical protein [Gracilibacillus salitolerans]QGH32591.1 hypothetical protein GI584_00155 [Gracilibacillus salitolerans]
MNNGESQDDQVIDTMSSDPQVVVPVDPREMTLFETDSGVIHIIHEITLGELITSTLIILLLVFMLISHVIRRFK